MKFGGDQPASTGFPKPSGYCQACGDKSTWHMIKIVKDGSWRPSYPHNVLTGWQSGTEPDWKKIELKPGLQHEGWIEYCNQCELQPTRPTPSTLTAEELHEHKDATAESVRQMLAEAQTKELPYNKHRRGEIV